MAENEMERLTTISKARTIEEIATFWDTHDLTDFEDQTREVEIEVCLPRRRKVTLAPELADRVAERARRDGISVETLVNLWVGEKLQVVASPA
jgi:predicted phosphatase